MDYTKLLEELKFALKAIEDGGGLCSHVDMARWEALIARCDLDSVPWDFGIEVVLARQEKGLIDLAMQQAGGVKLKAAQLLGISRYALMRRESRLRKVWAHWRP